MFKNRKKHSFQNAYCSGRWCVSLLDSVETGWKSGRRAPKIQGHQGTSVLHLGSQPSNFAMYGPAVEFFFSLEPVPCTFCVHSSFWLAGYLCPYCCVESFLKTLNSNINAGGPREEPSRTSRKLSFRGGSASKDSKQVFGG